MPFIIPRLTTRILRGEYPEILEVPHDPTRGWLDPEYPALDVAKRVIANLAWVYREVYPQNPHRAAMSHISLGFEQPVECNFH